MLDAYLHELERKLARTLPPEELPARLAEVEAHLREGIEARVELGMPLEQAGREAIQAFGEARRLAVAVRHAQGGDPTARLACLGTGYALTLFFLTFGWRFAEAYPASVLWLFGSWLVLGFGFALAAFRARRPRPFAIGLGVLIATTLTCLCLGATWLDLSAFGGGGVLSRADAARFLIEDRRLRDERKANRATLDAAWTAIHGPRGIEALRTTGGYRAPVVQRVRYRAPLRFGAVPDAKAALLAWSDLRYRGGDLFDTIYLDLNLASIPRAQADPWGNLVAYASSLFAPNLALAAFAILVDYAFGGLGSLIRRRWRRRRDRGVA